MIMLWNIYGIVWTLIQQIKYVKYNFVFELNLN